MQFSANISTMFREKPYLERFDAARNAGFNVIETQLDLYNYKPEEVAAAKGNMEVDLINLQTGDFPDGSLALPSHELEFISSTNLAINYHRSLNFKKLHILAGIRDEKFTLGDQKQTAINNLQSLVDHDFFDNINVLGLIEPQYKKNYFLNDFDLAISILDQVNSPQVKLLLDVYHLQKITGDAKSNLEKYLPYAGHVQISQCPGRVEPFAANGNIDYHYIFGVLREKYTGIIGLEYIPSGKTEDSLGWIEKYQKKD